MRSSCLCLLGVLIGAILPARLTPQTRPDTPPVSKIGKIGGKNLQEWIKEITNQDPSVAENAICTVVGFGPEAKDAVPALITQVDHGDSSVRVNAIQALRVIQEIDDKDLSKAVEELAKRVAVDPQAIVRFEAVMTLASFGPEAKAALPRLTAAVNDGMSWKVRKAAVFALGRVAYDAKNGPDKTVVTALVKGTSDTCAEVRLEAVISMGTLGRPGQADMPLADRALHQRVQSDRDERVALWARMTLMAYKDDTSDPSLKAVAGYLKSPRLVVRTNAARALGTIGDKAKSRIPELLDVATKDPEPIAAAAACLALGAMGPVADKAVPALTQVSTGKDTDEGVKAAAKQAIDMIRDVKPKKNP